ncbi:MAG: toll/interleukin-1 receptor domain-containing protein, partial [Candidatus Binataceae bacterium]
MDNQEIKIVGVIVDEVGQPRNDGSRGSALYTVPFRLSATPSREWAIVFIDAWNSPPRFTTMHRPGIARVEGARVVLDGTTIDEVEQYHLETLR